MTRTLVSLTVIAALAWALWPSDSEVADGDDLHTQLTDRAWIDHMPHHADEKIDLLFMDSDSRFGVFQNMSVYEGEYSIFAWGNQRSNRFDLVMLQQREDYRVRYRVSNRDCGEFDLCMVVEGAPRGARRYVSMNDWGQLGDRDAAEAQVRAWVEERVQDGSRGGK